MSLALFGRRRSDPTFTSLYGAIVAQARNPAFYGALGVPDTVEGRFDMIVLHLALVNRRFRIAAPPLRDAAQGVFDLFCADMDANLRELGVSDTGMAKRMRGFGEAFYGRAAAYDAALASGDPAALTAALTRNVFDHAPGVGAEALARYVRSADECLRAQDGQAIAAGMITFPDPPATAVPEAEQGQR